MNRVQAHYRAYLKHLKKEHPMLWRKYRREFDEWLPKRPKYS